MEKGEVGQNIPKEVSGGQVRSQAGARGRALPRADYCAPNGKSIKNKFLLPVKGFLGMSPGNYYQKWSQKVYSNEHILFSQHFFSSKITKKFRSFVSSYILLLHPLQIC